MRPRGEPPGSTGKVRKNRAFSRVLEALGAKTRPKPAPRVLRQGSPKRLFFCGAVVIFAPPPKKSTFFKFFYCERHVFYGVLWVEMSVKMVFGVPKVRILRGFRSVRRAVGWMMKKLVFNGESVAFVGR